MSDYMEVVLTGCNGREFYLEGPEIGRSNYELRPGPQMLIDAPAKTFWLQGAQRMHYQGRQFERRDPTFAINIFGDDPNHWRDLDSQLRLALGMFDDQFRMTIRTPDSERHLDLRLLNQPQAWQSGEWEKGKDPHLYRASTLLVNAAAEQPFWYADDWTKEW